MSNQLDKHFNVRIKFQNDSEENWVKKDFTPLDGEIIIYDIDSKNENKYYQLLKVGDGKTKLSQLPFINEITTSEQKGYLKINGKEVPIYGLQSMAFEKVSSYMQTEEYAGIIDDLSTRVSLLEISSGSGGNIDLDALNLIAINGNVRYLTQTDGEYLILNSNFEY